MSCINNFINKTNLMYNKKENLNYKPEIRKIIVLNLPVKEGHGYYTPNFFLLFCWSQEKRKMLRFTFLFSFERNGHEESHDFDGNCKQCSLWPPQWVLLHRVPGDIRTLHFIETKGLLWVSRNNGSVNIFQITWWHH